MANTNPVQGKTYTVQSGDSLRSIAKRAYGDEMQWSRLYRANVSTLRSSDPSLVYPGEVLFIPLAQEALIARQAAAAARFSSRAKGTLTFLLAGQEYRVTTCRFKPSIDAMAASWIVDMPWRRGDDPAFDKLIKPSAYTASELYLGPELVATGRLYGTSPYMADDGCHVELECWDLTADLVDSTMSPPYELADSTLEQLAGTIIKPLGYGVKIDCKTGGAFDLPQIESSEKIGAFFQRLATQHGILVTRDEYGNVVFTRGASGAPVAAIEEPSPFPVKWQASFDGRKLYNSYSVKGQAGDASPIGSVAKDTAVPAIRQITYTQGDVDAGNVSTSAKWRRSRAICDACQLPFPVADWYDPKGNLWRPNTIVSVKSPTLFIDKPYNFLIRDVEYAFEDGGRSATLSLALPLDGETIKAPWE